MLKKEVLFLTFYVLETVLLSPTVYNAPTYPIKPPTVYNAPTYSTKPTSGQKGFCPTSYSTKGSYYKELCLR